jgi:hypothetical protein
MAILESEVYRGEMDETIVNTGETSRRDVGNFCPRQYVDQFWSEYLRAHVNLPLSLLALVWAALAT